MKYLAIPNPIMKKISTTLFCIAYVPITERMITTGMMYLLGISMIFANGFTLTNPKLIMLCSQAEAAYDHPKRCGVSIISMGPGLNP